jgi:hypothetical protein
MSENSGPAVGRGFSRDNNITETAKENRRITSRQPQDPYTKIENKRIPPKKPYVYPGFDPSSTLKTTPTPTPDPVKGKKKKKTPDIPYKISKEVAPDSSNLVDSVNISELYVKAKAKIVLALIRNSKTLLGRYDFSGIDRITDYSLDADNSARQSEIVVSYIRPKPTVSLTEVMEQDVFMKNVNKINNQLNDFVSSTERDNLFGYETNGGFYPGSPKIVNGQARYDLIFKFYSPSSKIYRYRLYEIS